MKLNIKGNEITLKYSFRSMMIYEKIVGESFQPNGLTEVIIYLYSTILASKKEIDLSFDDFVDWLDDNPNTINEFNEWLLSIMDKNGYINQRNENGEVIDPKKA